MSLFVFCTGYSIMKHVFCTFSINLCDHMLVATTLIYMYSSIKNQICNYEEYHSKNTLYTDCSPWTDICLQKIACRQVCHKCKRNHPRDNDAHTSGIYVGWIFCKVRQLVSGIEHRSADFHPKS